MPQKMSFSSVGQPSSQDQLEANLKAVVEGHREAMQGLCCVRGRLRAIPGRDAMAALGAVIDGMDAEAQNRLPMTIRRIHSLHRQVTALLVPVDEAINHWVEEDAYQQIAADDAAKEYEEEKSIMEKTTTDDRFEY